MPFELLKDGKLDCPYSNKNVLQFTSMQEKVKSLNFFEYILFTLWRFEDQTDIKAIEFTLILSN